MGESFGLGLPSAPHSAYHQYASLGAQSSPSHLIAFLTVFAHLLKGLGTETPALLYSVHSSGTVWDVRPGLVPALTLGWLIGVCIGSLSPSSRVLFAVQLAGAGVTAAALSFRNGRILLLGLAVLASLLGIERARHAQATDAGQRARWNEWYERPAALQGIVKAVETRGALVRLTIESLRGENSQALPGTLVATAPPSPGLVEGSVVTVRGRVLAPERMSRGAGPPRGDTGRLFARRQIFGAMMFPSVTVQSTGSPRFLSRVRDTLRSALLGILPEPAAGLYSAFLLSFDRDLPRSLREQAATTGILHLVAISGSHIAVFAAFVAWAAIGLGCTRNIAAILTLGLAGAYVALVGFPESGVRAGIMAGAVAVAYLLGRPAAGIRVLGIACVVMTAVNPRILLGDVGFQLSALAVWGLLAIFPLLQSFTRALPNPFSLRTVLLLSLSAELATLPVVAYAFGRVPLIGPLTNLFAGVLFLPLFALGALTLVASVTVPSVASFVAPAAVAVGNAFLGIAVVGSRVPWHSITVPPFSLSVFLATVGVMFLLVQAARRWITFPGSARAWVPFR